jgi:hypothetical protein
MFIHKYIHTYIHNYILIHIHMYKHIGNCYFKSTDGHENKWSFSLSRMNLDFARAVGTEIFIHH